MKPSLSEILYQLGEDRDSYYGAMVPPVFQTSNFKFKNIAALKKALKSEFDNHLYTRGNNPTTLILRKKLAALEGTEDSLITGSGVAAISMSVLANLKAGDHAICIKNSYSWTRVLFQDYLPRFGIETTIVDGTKTENFKKAVKKNTRLIFLESPNTFLFELQDIHEVVKLAAHHNILVVMENTYATPLFQKPSEMGVDIIVHTASKYLAGHSDVVAGVICSDKKMIRKIYEHEFLTLGAICSPHDAWLILRGLRTLPVRMQCIADTTQKVISFLEKHPAVEKIIYPFHSSHPQYKLAKKQMTNCGGLFSVLLKTKDEKQIEQFCDKLKLFNIAVSWGGFESLVLPGCILIDKKTANQPGIPLNLVRFYIGLEEPDDLINDLSQALKKL